MPKREEWNAWHEEREAFLARDSAGFTQDLKALEEHIKKLTEICPKDAAGWPVGTALNHIIKLTKGYNLFKEYLTLGR